MKPSETFASARLLKADSARGLGSKVAFNFADFRKQGDAYLETVRNQARELVEHAQQESEQIRRQALERSIEDGRREGHRQAEESIEKRARMLADTTARETLATTLPAMKAAADAIAAEKDGWLGEWEKTAVRLAAAIAGRLLQHKIDVEPERAVDMIRAALQLASGTPQITVRLHPADVALMGAHADEVVRSLAACGEARVHSDPTIARGGCVIEGQHGTIDGRLETLLDRIVTELIDEYVS
jgi:flagellar biosynthesis/type III secretory pathway protein FliH